MLAFVERAQRLLDGRFEQSDTLFPPGQHLLIALSGVLFHGYDTLVLWTHLATGLLACFWMWRGAERFLGRRGALPVLVVGIFHFAFIGLAGYYLAETVFTALVALLFYLLCTRPFPWRPGRAFAVGLVAALGTVWKGTNTFLLPILGLWSIGWAMRSARRDRWPSWTRCWIFLVAGAAIVLGAQALYFEALYGRALPVAAGGAYNFTLDKCPGATIVGRGGARFRSPRAFYTGEGGIQAYDVYLHDQRLLWRRGFACVRERPWALVRSLRNIDYLFARNELWPLNVSDFRGLNRLSRRLYTIFLLPGIAVGLVLAFRKTFSPRTPPFLLVPSLFVTVWFFLGEMRFRIPFDTVFIPLGILGWTWALERALGRGRRAVIAYGMALACVLIFGVPVGLGMLKMW